MAAVDLSAVLDGLPDALLVCDNQGVIQYVNSRLCTLAGRGRHELAGMRMEALLREWPAPCGCRCHAVEQRELTTGSGAVIPVEVRMERCGEEGPPETWIVIVRSLAQGEPGRHAGRVVQGLRLATQAIVTPDALTDPAHWRGVVVRAVVDCFGAEAAGLWLVTDRPDSPTLDRVALREDATHSAQRLEELLDPNHFAWGHIQLRRAQGGQDVWVCHDPEGQSGQHPTWFEERGIGAVAYHPLLFAGEPQGVLAVFLSEPPGDEFTIALEAFAAVVGAGISDLEMHQRARMARDEMEVQRQRLQTVLDVLPVGVMLVEGPEARITLVNPAARAMGGTMTLLQTDVATDLVESIPAQHLDGTAFPSCERPLWRALHRGERSREVVRYTGLNGHELILEVAAAPYPGPRGGAIICFREVTEEVHLREEQAERASQFKALLDHLPVGVAYFDVEGICRAANGPARRILLGRPRAALPATTGTHLLSQSPSLREALESCLRDQRSYLEQQAPWPDSLHPGTERYLDWRFEPLPRGDRHEGGALALIVDVSDRKQAADQLSHAMESAVQASRNKTQFLSAVSHDLRTPVNALRLLAECLTQSVARPESTREELRDLTRELNAATTNLTDLINDLLELTVIDSGALVYHYTEFPLGPWLDEVLTPLAAMARAKGLELNWATRDAGGMFVGDRIKLSRVLLNLAGNAVKFTEQGGVDVSAEVAADSSLVLTVRDTGPGIPADRLDWIFDEFAQLRNAERDRTKGTGLGLAICRRLVQGAGGSLSVASEVNVGSTFVASYPSDPLATNHRQALPVGGHEAALGETPTRAGSGRILIVEDDAFSRRALARLLERDGYHVLQATCGLSALELLSQEPTDLVLLDLMLPGMDGMEVLDRIRHHEVMSDLPVVVVTGDVLDGRTAELEALQVDGILPKPLQCETLRQIIQRLLT